MFKAVLEDGYASPMMVDSSRSGGCQRERAHTARDVDHDRLRGAQKQRDEGLDHAHGAEHVGLVDQANVVHRHVGHGHPSAGDPAADTLALIGVLGLQDLSAEDNYGTPAGSRPRSS
jgi:hypothetical protein